MDRPPSPAWDTVPLSYRIDAAARIVITSTVGERVTLARVRLYQQALLADPAFDPTFSQYLDFSQASEIVVSPEDVRLLAVHSVFRAGSRRAIVADGPRVFGFARMFQALTDGFGADIRIFDDPRAAQAWLGMPSR